MYIEIITFNNFVNILNSVTVQLTGVFLGSPWVKVDVLGYTVGHIGVLLGILGFCMGHTEGDRGHRGKNSRIMKKHGNIRDFHVDRGCQSLQ